MIQIIDYGAGNLQSIKNALTKLEANYEIIKAPSEIKNSSKIIFAGVGAAGFAMKNLQKNGFDKTLLKLKNPFLGICLGMQLLFEYSKENKTDCLGIVKGVVNKFPIGMTTPQIGWNKISVQKSKLFDGVPKNSYFYFVNSYYIKPKENISIAKTEYGITFCSAIQKDNFYGVQFHPEKSGNTGQIVLNNFIKSC